MPFQSEKQRRYLWANEPEIAREWTDRYGASEGGITRLGFRRGNPHSDGGWSPGVGSTSSSSTTSSNTNTNTGGGVGPHGGGEWSGPTYSKPKTKTFTGPSRGEGIGSQTFDINKRTLAKQKQYRDLAYQRAHPFLSKIKSGLGSLGRGIGHVARNFNPVSLTFDNPLMKLLTSRYGQSNIRDLFQRNNQNINWYDPDEQEDFAWENINYDPNALTRLQQENLSGISHPDILPENKPYDSYFDDRNLMAEVTRPQYNTLKALGQVGNTGGNVDEIKGMVPAGTFDSIQPSEWDEIFQGKKFKDITQIT